MTDQLKRRRLSAALLLSCWGPRVFSQSAAPAYPSRPVRIAVPFPAGTAPDVVARAAGERLSQALGQPFVVESKVGASGALAADYVARAAPDGYTLMLEGSQLTTLPALNSKLSYDPVRDFAPISLMATNKLFLYVDTALGVHTLDEFVALLKARPGQLNYGTPGNGSLHHLMTEAFLHQTGTRMVHVPFLGGPPSVTAFLGRQIQALFTSPLIPGIREALNAGQIKVLGVAAQQRHYAETQVPTFAEQGFPDMDYVGIMAMYAPARTPARIVARLAAEMRIAMQHPDTVARLKTLGMEAVSSTPEALAALRVAEIEKYSRLVKMLGLKFE